MSTDKSKKKNRSQCTLEELSNPQIGLTCDALVYGRQSTKGQVRNTIQSHISQTILLLDYIRGPGCKDEKTTGAVILFVENQMRDEDGNIPSKNASSPWPIDRRLLVAKGNQPTLQEDLRLFFQEPPPIAATGELAKAPTWTMGGWNSVC